MRYFGFPAALAAGVLSACSSANDVDASGLTAAQKTELVERYYACARQQDARCVTATLHPEFRAEGEAVAAASRAGHGEAMTYRLTTARLEARILEHEGPDVWVVEVWNDRHGATTSLVRAFSFDTSLIHKKAVLAT